MILSEATLALLACHGDPTAIDALWHIQRGAPYAIARSAQIWILTK